MEPRPWAGREARILDAARAMVGGEVSAGVGEEEEGRQDWMRVRAEAIEKVSSFADGSWDAILRFRVR